MARYIDADELYKAAQKRIAEANEARMAVVDDEFLDLINDAFTEDVAPRAEWISVEERLPEDVYGKGRERITVLVCTKSGEVSASSRCAKYSYDFKQDVWVRTGEFGWSGSKKVTHWMPLPEPPKNP